MVIPESERLIAFEAAMAELSRLQAVACRYAPLRDQAEGLLSQLMDLGSVLRRAVRRGPLSEDTAETAVAKILSLRDEWCSRLAGLRESQLYQSALAAYAAGDQKTLCGVLPALFAGLEVGCLEGPAYQALALTTHRRQPGASPFRSPAAVADTVVKMREEGLVPRADSNEWWDEDLRSLSFADDLAALEGPAAVALDALPGGLAVFRYGDAVRIFTPRLRVLCSVIVGTSSDDTWWEAKEGSYEQYRDTLRCELEAREIPVRIELFGS